jgi:hypothetical protein
LTKRQEGGLFGKGKGNSHGGEEEKEIVIERNMIQVPHVRV